MNLLPTYILFTLDEDKQINRIYGPVLQQEIEKAKETQFEIYDEVLELPESMFKMLHSEVYFDDKRENWIDYLETILMSFYEVLPGYELNFDEQCIASEFFCIYKELENENILNISLSLSVNPIIAGLICFHVQKYMCDVMEVELSLNPFYFSPVDREYYHSNSAIKRYNAEKSSVFISQN